MTHLIQLWYINTGFNLLLHATRSPFLPFITRTPSASGILILIATTGPRITAGCTRGDRSCWSSIVSILVPCSHLVTATSRTRRASWRRRRRRCRWRWFLWMNRCRLFREIRYFSRGNISLVQYGNVSHYYHPLYPYHPSWKTTETNRLWLCAGEGAMEGPLT